MAGKRVELGSVARRGRRGGALPVATLMKTFAVWRLAVWQLATACGTCNGQQQQQRDGNRDGNGDGVGNWSRVISHVMAVWQSRILLHPSISLSLSIPASICRGPVQRLRLRLRQMATATGITALRCT